MISEADLLHEIRRVVGALDGVVLWRNQVGVAQHLGRNAPTVVRYGLARGAADLLGVVAPHGRFVAIEVKSPAGRVSPDQARFLALVESLGGVAGVARSVPEALAIVSRARQVSP